MLTGKVRRGAELPDQTRLKSKKVMDLAPPMTDEYLFKVVDALEAVAAETGKSVPQVAINWLLGRPTVSNVIIGARNEEQLKENLGCLGWSLTTAQVKKLDEASVTPMAYPYWHQKDFKERNPFPV